MNKKRLLAATVLGTASLMNGIKGLAQDPASQAGFDEDIKLLRKDLRSEKKQIIAANMDLTDAEAQQFWPIYDRYMAELATASDPKYALLKDYAQNYSTMSSEQAESYIKGRAAVDESIMKLRLKYFPIFRKVLSGKSTALFFQLDWRLGLILDLQLASQTPLIEL
jgi:hypothetical protein